MGSHASLKTSRTLWNRDRIGKSRSDLPKKEDISVKFHEFSTKMENVIENDIISKSIALNHLQVQF